MKQRDKDDLIIVGFCLFAIACIAYIKLAEWAFGRLFTFLGV